jgi:hypothetical protein
MLTVFLPRYTPHIERLLDCLTIYVVPDLPAFKLDDKGQVVKDDDGNCLESKTELVYGYGKIVAISRLGERLTST